MNATAGPMCIDEPSVLPRARVSRLRWFIPQVAAFAVGWSLSQALGEVVGEAWGGDAFHQLGHTVGSALTIALCSAAAWFALRRHITWISSWAVSGAFAAIIGGALWFPIVTLAPDVPPELAIALTLFLPLGAAAIGQARAVRNRVDRAIVWAVSWALGVLIGIAVQWYGSGGVDGISVTTVHPVLDTSTAYFWDTLPMSTIGAVAYAVTTAIALPIYSSLSDNTSTSSSSGTPPPRGSPPTGIASSTSPDERKRSLQRRQSSCWIRHSNSLTARRSERRRATPGPTATALRV